MEVPEKSSLHGVQAPTMVSVVLHVSEHVPGGRGCSGHMSPDRQPPVRSAPALARSLLRGPAWSLGLDDLSSHHECVWTVHLCVCGGRGKKEKGEGEGGGGERNGRKREEETQ